MLVFNIILKGEGGWEGVGEICVQAAWDLD